MQWLIYTREAALTVATITAIIAQAMGQLTINLSVGGVFNGSILYARLGTAAGCFTIISLPLFLLFDMVQEKPYSATVIFELIWMLALSIFWIVVGVETMGVTSSTFKTCSFPNATLVGICQEAQTLVVFALLSGVILLVYTAALGFVAGVRASGGNPIWTHIASPSKRR